MAEQPIRYEVVDSVAWLTINRPEARNALNNAVRTGLFDAVRRFNDDDAAKVLVLTGVGDKAFCAGGDLKEMAHNALKVPPKDFAPQFGRNIDVAKPTIAAVNGVAFAGGFLLAQQCDLVVAAEHATFAVSEVKVGRGSPWAAPLSWLVPPRVAMQILLTGDPITAERAHPAAGVALALCQPSAHPLLPHPLPPPRRSPAQGRPIAAFTRPTAERTQVLNVRPSTDHPAASFLHRVR